MREKEAALDARFCLPEDRRPEHYKALVTRAIFDSASYGRIRFHHRRVAEYLAARWLATRMSEGCPTIVLEDLLFDRVGDRRVIRRSLAPVTAWLCSGEERWNNDVRSWVLETAPGIHLLYGDPSCLPLDFKRRVLQALVKVFKGRKRVWVDAAPDSLSRLADPGLAAEVSAIIRDRSLSVDLRGEMLQMVRHGRLVGCLDAALEIIAAADESDELKSYAVTAIRDNGTPSHRRRLADVAAGFPTIPSLLCAYLCEALYPEAIDAAGLANLLRKAEEVPRYSVDLPWHLKKHLESKLEPDGSGPLLAEFVGLGQEPPRIMEGSRPTPISARFYWIEEAIPNVLIALLNKPHLTDDESETAARALWLLGHSRHYGGLRRELPCELDAATRRHPEVRQRFLWRLVDEWRREHKKEPSHLFQLFGHYEVVQPIPRDLEWLGDDIKERESQDDREVALRLALGLWHESGRRWRDRRLIRRATSGHPNLGVLFHQLAANGPLTGLRRIWYRHIRNKFGERWWWEQQFYYVQEHWNWIREKWILLRQIHRLASGTRAGLLSHLVHEGAAEIGHNQWTPTSWEGLRKKRGWLIAWAVKKGCKKAWHRFIPRLPHEKPKPLEIDGRIIVGLAGLQAAIADGEIDLTSVSNEEAILAARYAVNELNGSAPWFQDLTKHQPKAVSEVLTECIRGEWMYDAGREHVHDVIRDLVWQGDGLFHLVQHSLVAQLRVGDPPNARVLQFALTLLLKQKEPLTSVLAEMAPGRIRKYSGDSPQFILWLAVWLQIDAQHALPFLMENLKDCMGADRLMVRLCEALGGESLHHYPLIPNPDFLRPACLRNFIPLVYRHVRPSGDIDRTGMGAYTPDDRDFAQRFRDTLLGRLAGCENSQADAVLRELIDEPTLAHLHDWMLHLLEERSENHAELPPWVPEDIRSFAKEYETDPKTERELFNIARRRLLDIKHDVEKSDNSLRDELRIEDDERHLRRWLARKLNERSRKRYTVPQEEEIDQQQRPDLRIEKPGVNPISLEVKWGDRWSLADLLERLENQLVGQYLRAHNSRYGIYLLGNIGNKEYWVHPSDQGHLSFNEVLQVLEARAKEIVANRPGVADVAVIGIDFREPSKKSKA